MSDLRRTLKQDMRSRLMFMIAVAIIIGMTAAAAIPIIQATLGRTRDVHDEGITGTKLSYLDVMQSDPETMGHRTVNTPLQPLPVALHASLATQ